jgi:EmrB/QacA subfamily drug resistance transporter
MERKWRVLIVVCVAVFMLLLDITVVNVALPDIQRELHTSFTDLQWVVDAYALTLAATMLNAGSLGDLLGRKRVFLVAIALFTIASTLCGAAQSPEWLIIARGAQGIGGAGMFAVSLAIISQEFHGRERSTAFGIWGATVGMAVAIGPLVGGALTTYVGWRWIFFVNIPIGIACIAGGLRELHETRDEGRGGLDLPGLVTLTTGLFALVLGLLRGNDWGWSSGRVVGLFAGGAILLVAFGLVELRQASPMFDLRLFRVPTFTGAQITAFAISSGMFAQFLYLALYLESVLGHSAVWAGVRFLPLSLVSFVVAPIAGRLSARRRAGDRRSLTALDLGHQDRLGLDDPPPRLHRRRHRNRHGQRAARVDSGQRRRASAGGDGLGDQQHLPPGRDRDGHRGARRDLPEPDRVASRFSRRARATRPPLLPGDCIGCTSLTPSR